MSDQFENQSLDLIWGAEAIAATINRKDGLRGVYNLLERGQIASAKKVGGMWCVSRSKLLEQFGLEAA